MLNENELSRRIVKWKLEGIENKIDQGDGEDIKLLKKTKRMTETHM